MSVCKYFWQGTTFKKLGLSYFKDLFSHVLSQILFCAVRFVYPTLDNLHTPLEDVSENWIVSVKTVLNPRMCDMCVQHILQ